MRRDATASAAVSIVIPVFNRAELTRDCLAALAATTRDRFAAVPGRVEVIVVDNASTDDTPALLAGCGSAITVVRHDENLGFARACNAGARHASGAYVVFLNNDTVPQPHWLDALVAAADSDPAIGAVGARLLYPNGTIQHAGLAFTPDFEPVHAFHGVAGDAPEVSHDRDCEAVTGACLLMPRALFLELGGFDEGYRMYFEDVDLCLRVRAAGRRVRYAAASVVVHLERASSPSFGAAFALNRESRLRFRERWLPVGAPADDAPSAATAPGRPQSRRDPATVRHAARTPQVLFQARPNLFSHPGGDTVVVQRSMRGLERLGARVRFASERGIPAGTDVVHTINFATPETTRGFAEDADRAGVPLVVTTLYEDWPRYLGLSGAASVLFRLSVDPSGARRGAALNRQTLATALSRARGVATAARPQNDVTAAIARVLFCCSDSERRLVVSDYPTARDVRVVPFGADLHVEDEAPLPPGAFSRAHDVRDFVLCVARLEARKNQLMLLEALRDDPRPLVLVSGGFAYNAEYARLCRAYRRRGRTLVLERLPSAMLAAAFRDAAVHCLPSWFELPGLVSLEAALHGTRVAASSWGAIEDYLGDAIAYLEPDDPESIRRAIERAATLDPAVAGARAREFTWERTARATLTVYEEIAAGTTRRFAATWAASEPAATPTHANGKPAPVEPVPDAPTALDPAASALAAAAHARADGDWDAVLRHADAADRAGAEHARVAELRALALTRLGRLDDAEAEFASLLGTAPYRRRAETGLGIIALERGDAATARTWLERATAAGADADAWAALGLCLGRLACAEDAWRAYVEARALDPSHRAALHGLITLASPLDRLVELETHLRDYLARNDDDPDVRYALAGCLLAAGRRDESHRTVQEVLRAAPAHTLAIALDRELAS